MIFGNSTNQTNQNSNKLNLIELQYIVLRKPEIFNIVFPKRLNGRNDMIDKYVWKWVGRKITVK